MMPADRDGDQIYQPEPRGDIEPDMYFHCEHGYIPTTQEYFGALGPYGTAIQSVGALITVALMVFYIEHIIFTYKNTHTVYRRHINWIACFYPVGALMSMLALIVPRAYSICMAVKILYFSLSIRHFVDLTVKMYGCEKGMLARLTSKVAEIDFRVGPFSCCSCIPSSPVTKLRLRLVRWMIYQLPYTQSLYFFLEIYWTSSETDSQGLIVLNYGYLALDLLNLISTLVAVYALGVLAHLVNEDLKPFNYKRKSATLIVLLFVLKVPSVILTALGNYDILPCIPLYINSVTYAHMVVNLFHLVLVAMFGGLEYWQYHTEEFLTPVSDKHHVHSQELVIHGQASVCIIAEMTDLTKPSLMRRRSSTQPIVVQEKSKEEEANATEEVEAGETTEGGDAQVKENGQESVPADKEEEKGKNNYGFQESLEEKKPSSNLLAPPPPDYGEPNKVQSRF